MARSGGGFRWRGDTLSGNVRAFPLRVERAVFAAIEFNAPKALTRAMTTAPWTDRMGNARSGLFTLTQHEPFRAHRIIISHSVPYGIWLEVRHQGKYAVIVPTTNWTGKQVMRTVSKLFSTMGR